MSHALPDDSSRWPSNPYELLGVAHGVSPRDLRKAYTNLIRIFKPEHHPDEFRKIREAFETLQRYAAFYVAPSEPNPEIEAEASPPTEPERSPTEPEFLPRIVEPSVEDLWEQATSDPAGAYQAIVERLDRRPIREDLYARLYWLTVLYPEVAVEVIPSEWLVRGLHGRSPSGLLFVLYSSEILSNPLEAESTRMNGLLEGASSEDELITLLRLRWESLARAERWRIVHDDFRRYRERIIRADELAWLRLMLNTMNWLPWHNQDHVAEHLRNDIWEEFRLLEHLALRNQYYFDQLEYQEELFQRWRHVVSGMPVQSGDFLPLIHDSRLIPFEQIRVRLEAIMRQMSDDPVRWLEWLDEAGRRGQPVLSKFDELLSTYRSELEIDDRLPHAPAQVRQHAAKALNSRVWSEARLREHALAYCLDECSGPDLIAAAFHPSVNSEESLPDWVQSISGDLGLHLVCRAARLFRA